VSQFDLAIRGGTIVTARDEFRADIGIRDGRIVSIADRIEGGGQGDRCDGLGWLCTGWYRQPRPYFAGVRPDVVMADDFASATRAAAAGGNTTILPSRCRIKGSSLRACVESTASSRGECYIDTSFHLIISDPTAVVLGQELPGARQGLATRPSRSS
jgi:dihydropyrimidinase